MKYVLCAFVACIHDNVICYFKLKKKASFKILIITN